MNAKYNDNLFVGVVCRNFRNTFLTIIYYLSHVLLIIFVHNHSDLTLATTHLHTVLRVRICGAVSPLSCRHDGVRS